MAIAVARVTINGETHDLQYNSATNKYEATLTAPAASSFPLDGGYYPVAVYVEDTAGNSATADDKTEGSIGEALRLVVKEKNKPTVTVTSPTAGAYITNSRPPITFTAVDNILQTSGYSGINKDFVSVTVSDKNGSKVYGITDITAETLDGGFKFSLSPSADIADGNCTVVVKISDNDGNEGTATASFTVDTLAPSLTIDSPQDNFETNQPSVIVSGTAAEDTSAPVTVKVSVNGGDEVTAEIDDSGRFNVSVELEQNTENVISITATDRAGKSTTVTRNVKHKSTAPVISAIEITPNPADSGQTYIISVTVDDE